MRLKPKQLAQLFLENFPPDKNGWTRPVLMSELLKISPDFYTTNGCDWARSDTSWLGKRFLIKREKKNRKIFSVQLCGFNVKPKNHTIPYEIKKEFSKTSSRCVVLDISQNIEIDHKNGRYNQKEYTVQDFQPLNKTVNDSKRQHCKQCAQTGKRFDAKRLGSNISFFEGDEFSNTCEGCYWNDPFLFWQKVTKKEI